VSFEIAVSDWGGARWGGAAWGLRVTSGVRVLYDVNRTRRTWHTAPTRSFPEGLSGERDFGGTGTLLFLSLRPRLAP
jgi:hypothetical protein